MKIHLEFDSTAEHDAYCASRAEAGTIVDVALAVSAQPEPPAAEPAPTAPAEPKKTRKPRAKKVVADPEPAPDPVAALKEQFSQLVTVNYDKASDLLEQVDCETFSEVIESGKADEFAALLAA